MEGQLMQAFPYTCWTICRRCSMQQQASFAKLTSVFIASGTTLAVFFQKESNTDWCSVAGTTWLSSNWQGHPDLICAK